MIKPTVIINNVLQYFEVKQYQNQERQILRLYDPGENIPIRVLTEGHVPGIFHDRINKIRLLFTDKGLVRI